MLFRVTETDAEIEARLDKWDKYLEQEDEQKEKKKAQGANSAQQQKSAK